MMTMTMTMTTTTTTTGRMRGQAVLVHLVICLLVLISYSPTKTLVDAFHRSGIDGKEDKSKYLLFIHLDPTQKSQNPVDDETTRMLIDLMARAEPGTSHYDNVEDRRGTFHPGESYDGVYIAPDGEMSDNMDYLLPNRMITHSLAVHYVRYYRTVLPRNELKKLKRLAKFVEKEARKKEGRMEEF